MLPCDLGRWSDLDEVVCHHTSPYARLARIIVIEKALDDRVEIIEAKTRTQGSPYYQINPSGRVPYLVDDAGIGMEDSQLICAYLDNLHGKPRFHDPLREPNWAYLRLEFMARSMCDGISVWTREMSRPTNERSPTVLAHEVTRSQRMADIFESYMADPLMRRPPRMAHLILAVAFERARYCGLNNLTDGRPQLAKWMRSMSDLPSNAEDSTTVSPPGFGARKCPLSGVKQTSLPHRKMSAYDPKRILVGPLPSFRDRLRVV